MAPLRSTLGKSIGNLIKVGRTEDLAGSGTGGAGKDEQINSKNIGVITSGTISPTLSKAIALAYVVKDFSFIGTEVFIKIRNKEIKAKVVSLPFVK